MIFRYDRRFLFDSLVSIAFVKIDLIRTAYSSSSQTIWYLERSRAQSKFPVYAYMI
jgi:hypothetical protein